MRGGEVAQENTNARAHEFFKLGKFQMKLERMPQADRALPASRALEPTRSASGPVRENIRRDMRADIAGLASQEYSHVLVDER